MSVDNAHDASKLLYVPRIDEQGMENAIASSLDGTFIGMSRIYSMPFFLDPEGLMNPHIFITGITGSGKTYLTRNLMLKLYAVLGSIVIVIDFTGEYAAFADLFSALRAVPDDIDKIIDEGKNRIVYVNLKKMSEAKKVSSAVEILEKVTEKMRLRGHGERNMRVFVVLDEAWKLVEKSKPLEIIVREGRKYKVGIVIASQIIGDIDAPFLSNIATLFVFRVQDRDSLDVLRKNYNLREDQVALIQSLSLGSCFVIQVNKFNVREAFAIKQVIGIEAAAPMKMIIGEKMTVEIGMGKFETMVKRACSGEKSAEIVARAKEKGYMRLDTLITELLERGADRRVLLAELQHLGIKDEDLADAFALSVAGKSNGKA